MSDIEVALNWVILHKYQIYVHDVFEISHMIRLGCYSQEDLHARASEMEVDCLVRSTLEEFEDEVCDLIDSAFEHDIGR